MATTSLKLSEDLKARAARLAEARGQSPHAYMVDAIRKVTEEGERREQFIADALLAREQAVSTNKAIPANKVHAYVRKKVQRRRTTRPKPTSWRK